MTRAKNKSPRARLQDTAIAELSVREENQASSSLKAGLEGVRSLERGGMELEGGDTGLLSHFSGHI